MTPSIHNRFKILMSIEVHNEALYRRYYAPIASASFLYFILKTFLLIFLPLIIAYNSSSFWLKDDIYYEQPVVAYRYQAIFEWGGYKSNKESLNLYYSTSSTMNDLYEKQLRIPLLRTREIDVNLDGKIDRIELNVQVPLEIGETIHSFTGCVYTDIQFNGKSKYYFDAAAYLQYGSPLPMTSLLVDGTYMIHQTWPLTAKGGYHVPYESDPLFPQLNGLTSADEVSLEYVMTKYAARNVSMEFRPTYSYRTASYGGDVLSGMSAAISSPPAQSPAFNATIVIRVPESTIRYTPAVSQVLKTAWIQYVSFFFIIWFLLDKLSSFVFRNQLLTTLTVADIVKKMN